MSESRTPPADWVVPAVIVGVGVGLFLVVAALFALTTNAEVEASGLVYELEEYTTCLSGHGANVPVVEARKDGGFSVTVPGSLVDGGVDTTAWGEAHDRCSDVAPDLFGGLFAGLSGGLFGGLMDGFPSGIFHDG